jgi:enoyl-CoA hydratase
MSFTALKFDQNGPVATVTITREERRNAFDRILIDEMNQVAADLEGNSGIRVVIMTGSGSAFSAGADIKERLAYPDDISIQRSSVRITSLFSRLEKLDQILIAAVNGPATGGGCELALACDLRIASDQALFALPEVRLGILPGAGATQRLPRIIGPGRAKEMMFLGHFVGPDQAMAWGLVNRVVSSDQLMIEARKVADELLAVGPISLGLIKSSVNTAMSVNLDSGIQYEQRCSHLLSLTEDKIEGYRAFVERRKPEFQGK